ncbi:MAG: 3-hydroxybutyrate dehydrogenase [Alphaproteobacteria bacterium]|nr:3-hydroxybutyrate dehydrogenase [Alphaproteobacteria bacterium]
MFNNKLKDKVALVTGSSTGIGKAIAFGLLEQGCRVALNGLATKEQIDDLLHQASAITPKTPKEQQRNIFSFYAANMQSPNEIYRMIHDIIKDYGQIDILVNNAGIQYVSPIDDFPEDKWHNIIDINLNANFYTIKHILPVMKKNGWGRIINIVSAHGLVASPFKSAYVAAKHGLIGLTKTVALETAQMNITCNAICPGYVKTALVEKQIQDQAKAHQIPVERVIEDIILAPQPTKKFVDESEVTTAVIFLCQPQAASITGIALPIDGGWTAR